MQKNMIDSPKESTQTNCSKTNTGETGNCRNEETTFTYTSEWLEANTEIHGWLVFFCFWILTTTVISGIYHFSTFNIENYGGLYAFVAFDITDCLIRLAIALFTIYAFGARKPNSVFWGKVYVSND